MSVLTGKGNTSTRQLEKSVEQVAERQSAAATLLSLSFKAQIIADRATGSNVITDEMILVSADVVEYPEFEDNHFYQTVGEIFRKDGLYYEVVAPHTSNAAAYPVETTFAYYRLIELTHAGTQDDPIPYPEAAGILVAVKEGAYYAYKGKMYLAKADMPNCAYPPDTPGMWQWEAVE